MKEILVLSESCVQGSSLTEHALVKKNNNLNNLKQVLPVAALNQLNVKNKFWTVFL